MRTEQLEYVAAVARLGSIRRASEELHISQPALSETIRNLERELGVEIFTRGRTGASLSADGRELLAHISDVTDAVDNLRRAADAQHHVSRMVRVATVNAGTAPVLFPAVSAFTAEHPDTQVEVVDLQEDLIHRGLREGSLDLGLITCLAGDDPPAGYDSTELLRGGIVVCLRPDDPLAAQDSIELEALLAAPLIVMRSGYLMHRYLHRLLGGRPAQVACSTDGAEMGKLMVTAGLGVTLLPQFSVTGDPLERAGLITSRPLSEERPAEIALVLRRRSRGRAGRSAQSMHTQLIEQARRWSAGGSAVPAVAG